MQRRYSAKSSCCKHLASSSPNSWAVAYTVCIAKVRPVTAVEIEVSISSYEQQTKDVIATAKELGIAVVAYSYVPFPLAHRAC